MRKLPVVSITVVIHNQHRWAPRFVCRPNVQEVIAAAATIQNEAKRASIIELLEKHGLPLDNKTLECRYVGVKVGTIDLSTSMEPIMLPARAEENLPLFAERISYA